MADALAAWRRARANHGWTALEDSRSRATDTIFTEVTRRGLGAAIPAFRTSSFRGWTTGVSPRRRLHARRHGPSRRLRGRFDGDGLDDLYVSQPSGLPNRLFRNKGDGTFEDITEAAGLAVLDRTSQSLFIDVDNDGDEDLVLVARSGPLLFTNNGRRTSRGEPRAFQLAQPLRGTLTSAAAADYDRDGFLDLYLCAYSFLIGASEDKAGPARRRITTPRMARPTCCCATTGTAGSSR